jgi:hypothetical protein
VNDDSPLCTSEGARKPVLALARAAICGVKS